MQEFAKSLGVDTFQITKSTKFGSIYNSYGSNDPLEPSIKFVSSSHRFEREQTEFTNRNKAVNPINLVLYNNIKDRGNTVPLCEIGNKGLYIDAQGRLFPCCWVANRYNHNNEWQAIANNFNLHNRSLQDALADTFWETELKTFRWQECQTKCNSKIVNEKYATQW
jgi:hypothetical protein